ncbi:MAG TPA: hypothetical protein DCM54_02780 [Gammaproteobacteria bacterium]|mgnify:CR=1 FL=1|nr:hypothetical protein [Gammaproteobacteria bacterium]
MILVARTILVFILLSTTMIVNQEDNLLARLGITGDYLILAIFVLICTLMLSARPFHIIAVTVVLSLAANMPVDFSLNLGVDRDLYGGFMVALLFQPLVNRLI